jgi:signal-transduction protein with cAMP-binding, CBS, and nucleotidyltransferase domain
MKEDDLVQDCINTLKNEKGGSILIIDQVGKLSGIFTERDVLKKVIGNDTALKGPLSAVMTKNPMTIQMTSPLAFSLQLMSEGGFRHVPIVDDEGYPLGCISMKDIVDEVVRRYVLE